MAWLYVRSRGSARALQQRAVRLRQSSFGLLLVVVVEPGEVRRLQVTLHDLRNDSFRWLHKLGI